MVEKTVTLRCDDNAEAVVFTKYNFYSNSEKASEFSYEICVEDSYIGGDYKGFFGRIKRAWRAFWDKPVVYTGIYCEDADKMKKFLCDCLDLVDDNSDSSKYYGIDPYYLEHRKDELDNSVTTNEELIKTGEW